MEDQEFASMIAVLATEFDYGRYPESVYAEFVDGVQNARSPTEMGESLAVALAWKDGKVRLDALSPKGRIVHRTHPNTLSPEILATLKSDGFYEDAVRMRSLREFDVNQCRSFRRHGLWQTVVIPAFVLHCLAPGVFPIVDQHVMRAFRFRTTGTLDASIRVESYAAYHDWWAELCVVAGIDRGRRDTLTQGALKRLDAGLMVYGKSLKKARGPRGGGSGPAVQNSRGQGTSSEAFISKACAAWQHGATQREAMKLAAASLGVELPKSYLQYPGSHFGRWRKQGLCR